jgi:hypothetical protein
MPDFEEGRTEMVEDNQWPDMLIALTEVFANTPAAYSYCNGLHGNACPEARQATTATVAHICGCTLTILTN